MTAKHANYIVTKKAIARAMDMSVKQLTKLMAGDDPPPVRWDRSKSQFVLFAGDLPAWQERQRMCPREADQKGLGPKRRRSGAGAARAA